MPRPTADSDSSPATPSSRSSTRSSTSTDSDPLSRRRAALQRAAACALAIAAAAGCSSTRPAPREDSVAKSTTVAASTASTSTASGGTAAVSSAAPEPSSAPAPAPTPAPAPAPAPAIRPYETFDAVWTTVRDQHFDKTLNGVDWNAVRAEYEPKVRTAASQDELRGLLTSMLGRLGQSHFGILPSEEADASPSIETQHELADAADAVEAAVDGAEPSDLAAEPSAGGPGIAGLDVALVEGAPTVVRVTPGLSAARAGVLVGWEVVSVEGRSVQQALQPLRESLAAEKDPDSPHARQLRMMLAATSSHLVVGSAGERRRVVFRDASGAEQEVTIAFEPAPLGSSFFGNLPPFPIEVDSRVVEIPIEGGKPVKVGYLSFNIWMTGASAAIDKGIDSLRGCDGIVIDLRGNPGGIGAMSMGVAGHFVNESMSLGSMIGRDTTLAFTVTPRKVSAAGKRVRPISKPLAILLDARSGSTSEVFAGGLQSVGRARVFGEASAGMALPARAVELPNGDVLLHAVADFTTSTGVRLEGKGVIPDAPAALTRSGLNKGIDEVFESAATWIREQTVAARAAKPTADATPPARLKPRERAVQRANDRAARAAASVTVQSP